MRALAAAGVAGLVIILSGCGDQTGPLEKSQDTINDSTSYWSCVNDGGTWNGSVEDGSCK